jgi:hypothetical protein
LALVSPPSPSTPLALGKFYSTVCYV